MAGAAIELTESIIVNPNDLEQIEKAILDALQMPEQEQLKNMKLMQQKISRQTVNKWAKRFCKRTRNHPQSECGLQQEKNKGTYYFRDSGGLSEGKQAAANSRLRRHPGTLQEQTRRCHTHHRAYHYAEPALRRQEQPCSDKQRTGSRHPSTPGSGTCR